VVVLLGGILGTTLAPTPLLATLPASAQIVGVALSTIPAALFMQRFGRRLGFILSACTATGATLLASWAVAHQSFTLLCLATALIGVNNAFALQYRFAAAEFVPPEKVGKAVGLVMIGTLVAVWIGPTLALYARHLLAGAEFAGSFLATSGLYLIAIAILTRLPDAGREVQLASERLPLDVWWREVAEEVEADLTHRPDSWVRGEGLDRGPVRLGCRGDVVGVDAGRGVEEVRVRRREHHGGL